MKTILHIALIASAVVATGCGLDNYDEPDTLLTGRVTCAGDALHLRHGSIRFDLEQDAWELGDKIEVVLSQEGTFSARLFRGDYRLVPRPGNGPWTDDCPPVEFALRGDRQLDIEVVPFYLLDDARIALSGTAVDASCTVRAVAGGRPIEALTLYVGKTRFVDDRGGRSIASAAFDAPAEGAASVRLDIAEQLERHPTLYARIGLKIEGIDERIYTEVIQIQ